MSSSKALDTRQMQRMRAYMAWRRKREGAKFPGAARGAGKTFSTMIRDFTVPGWIFSGFSGTVRGRILFLTNGLALTKIDGRAGSLWGCKVLGLLGLLGAVFAGFMVDAFTSESRDDDARDHEEDGATGVPQYDDGVDGGGSLLDDPAAANDPDAGMPASRDGPAPRDEDVTLAGGAANDILTGEDGNDQISGDAGNDLLGGRAGDDVIDGGDGVDWMHGGEGADTMRGAEGTDDLHGEAGDDRLDGGDGNDSLSGDGGRDRLTAGAGDDGLVGGEGADVLRGGTGDDALQGGLGHDRAMGGDGSDVVDGNDGNDVLWGDRAGQDDGAVDFLNGGNGDDDLHAGSGDYANGGAGADRFVVDDIAAGDPVAQIVDFDRQEDALVLLYDAAHHADPAVSIVTEAGSPDAVVLLDGIPVAHVLGGAGLKLADVTLQAV